MVIIALGSHQQMNELKLYYAVLFSHKEEENYGFCIKMDESIVYNVKEKSQI
jgi:hypothetical protein